MTAIGHALALGGGRRFSIRLETALRVTSVIVGVVFAVIAVGFYTRADWATAIWPWPDVRMSYVFLASIAAAICAPALWIAVTGELAAYAGIWLNTAVVYSGAAVYLTARAIRHGDADLVLPAAVSVGAIVVSALLVWWFRRFPIRDPRPTPRFVRWSFVGFAVVLIAVAIPLVLQVERVFPWDLSAGTSTLIGCIFLGPSCYFLYGALQPRWALSAGQLWSFLAYDLVLATPYVKLLTQRSEGTSGLYADYGYGSYGAGTPAGDGVNEASLAVYLAVIGFSTALACYYLFVDRRTRVISRPPASDPV